MEIAIVGVACQVTLDAGGSVTDARIAITALAPTIHRVPEAEVLRRRRQRWKRGDPGGRRCRRRGEPADLGRPRLRALPQGDGRRDRPPRDRRRARARRRSPRPDSRESGAARRRGGLEMLYQAVLAVNGVEYPINVEAAAVAALGAAQRDRAHRQQGGVRRLRVRRLHGADRRPPRELVQLPRAAGERARDHDGRGTLERRRAAPAAARVPRRRAACSAGSARPGC